MRAELAKELVDGAPCPVCGSLDHPELCELPTDWVSREAGRRRLRGRRDRRGEGGRAGREVVVVDTVIGDLVKRLAERGLPGSPRRRCRPRRPESGRPPDADAALAPPLEAETTSPRSGSGRRGACRAHSGRRSNWRPRRRHRRRQRQAGGADRAAHRRAGRGGRRRGRAGPRAPGQDPRPARRRPRPGRRPPEPPACSPSRSPRPPTRRRRPRAPPPRHKRRPNARSASRTGAGFGVDSGAVPAARAAFKDAALAPRRRRPHPPARGRSRSGRHAARRPRLAVELDPPAPVAETTAAAGQAQRAHDAANSAHGTASHTAEQLAVLKPLLEDALAALEPLRERAEEVEPAGRPGRGARRQPVQDDPDQLRPGRPPRRGGQGRQRAAAHDDLGPVLPGAHRRAPRAARSPGSGCWPATRGPASTATRARCPAARRSSPASRSRSASPTW